MSGCRFVLTTGERCVWCHSPSHRGPNPPDTPTAGESGEAATGDTSAPVAADIAADYPWFMRVLASEFVDLDSRVEEARQALAEIEAGRNAIAALRMFRRDLLVKDRYTARLEAELADAKQHEAHWRKEADSWKESVEAQCERPGMEWARCTVDGYVTRTGDPGDPLIGGFEAKTQHGPNHQRGEVMHDPLVVAFTVPSFIPRREKWSDKRAERAGKRWGWLIDRRTNPENLGQRTYRWWRLEGRNLVLGGRVYGLRDAFTIWHVEPKGRDAFSVCKHNTRWKWHVHHWRVQVHYEQRLRRFLLERCEHCGHRYPWGYAPVSHQWDSPRSRWRDGVVKRAYHHECSAAIAWKGNNGEAAALVALWHKENGT